jgi:DNA-binding YbaB/EbfC family protein
MPGVGKLLKQAQKMQKKMEALQEELASRELTHSAGGGAVTVKVNGQSELLSLKIDPEFLKEDAELVEETLSEAVRAAMKEAKELHEEEMSKIQSGMQMPGFM